MKYTAGDGMSMGCVETGNHREHYLITYDQNQVSHTDSFLLFSQSYTEYVKNQIHPTI